MCRFVLYLGPPLVVASLVTEPENSIINQSVHSRESEEPLNGDGFGVAWYAPDFGVKPALFRAVTPAWSNHNLLNIARVTKSKCILAHVRAATSGLAVIETNCHPFAHNQYAFMHNGDVGGFHEIRREILAGLSDEAFDAIHGNTDSEHLFAVFLDRVRESKQKDPAEAMAEALEAAVAHVIALGRRVGVKEQTYVTAAVTNGVEAVACRITTDEPKTAPSLHVDVGRRYVCDKGVCRMVSPEKGKGAVIIASEPLGGEKGWHTVAPNHVALVGEDQQLRVREWRGSK